MTYSNALGVIEAVGLPAAIASADAALKAANVALIGYELSRGPGGNVTVKLSGNIGAIQAAVAAGCAAAEKVGRVAGKLIIPRPHNDLEQIIMSPDTVFAVDVNEKNTVNNDVKDSESANQKEVITEADNETTQEEVKIEKVPAQSQPTCNLCGDPACPRYKGEPHGLCIHAKD